METGEFAAKMPMSFVMGVPGFGRQSQCWVMSLAKLTYETLFCWKVSSTPRAAEARALQRFSLSVNCMAFVGHSLLHMGHRIHNGEVMWAFLFITGTLLFCTIVTYFKAFSTTIQHLKHKT